MGALIRIVTLDRQPLMRRGLEAALREQRDLVSAGVAADAGELWPLLYRTDPDLVLLGVDEPAAALDVCLRLKRRPLAPRVVLYADAGTDLTVPAALARADGIAHRSEPTAELLRVIRDAAAGKPVLPPISPREQTRAAARLDAPDHAIFAMALAGTPAAEIATTLRLGKREVGQRTAAIVARLVRPGQRPRRDRRGRGDGLLPAIGSRPAPA